MATIFFAVLIQQLMMARASLRIAIQVMLGLEIQLENKINYLLALYDHMNEVDSCVKDRVESSPTVTFNVRGSLFVIDSERLNALSNLYFQTVIASDPTPVRGHYFIDRPYEGFERIVNAVSGGELSYGGLNDYEAQCVDDNLEYFKLPFPRLKRIFSTSYMWNVLERVFCLFVLQDGRLCFGLNNGKIKIWNASGECELELVGSKHSVAAIIQLSDGRVCAAFYDGAVKLWNLSSGECEASLEGHSKYCIAVVQYSSTQICSSSGDKTIKLWDLQTGFCEKTIDVDDSVQCFELLRNGYVATMVWHGPLQIWDVMKRDCIRTIRTDATNMIQLPSGDLCSLSRDGSICIWDYLTGQELKSFPLYPKAKVEVTDVPSLLLLRDGRLCVASQSYYQSDGALTGCISIYNLAIEECEQTFEGFFHSVAQLIDGRLCCATTDNTIYLWA